MQCGDCRQTMGTSCCPDSTATHFAFGATPKRNFQRATCAFEHRRTCAEPAVEALSDRAAFLELPNRATCHRGCCSTMQTTTATRARHRTTSIPLRCGTENPDSPARARARRESHRQSFHSRARVCRTRAASAHLHYSKHAD